MLFCFYDIKGIICYKFVYMKKKQPSIFFLKFCNIYRKVSVEWVQVFNYIYCSPSNTTLFLLYQTMATCFGLLDHHQTKCRYYILSRNSYFNWYAMLVCVFITLYLFIFLTAHLFLCISECVFYSRTHLNICHLYKLMYPSMCGI
jgi:hypothetical protein